MTETAQRCRRCGQKLRASWRCCPSCREPVQGAAAAGQAPERRGGTTVVLLVACLALGVVAWGLNRRAAPSPAPAVGVDAAGLAADAAPSATLAAARGRDIAPEWAGADAAAAGAAAYQQGDMTAALAAFEKATELNPGDVTARANMAQVLVRVGRAAEALPHLDVVIEQRPGEWAARFNRARAYALLERWAEARADYEAAAAAFPDDHVTLFNLGLVYRKTADHAAAVAAFERVLAVAPDYVDVLIPLAQEYLAVNRVDQARDTFRRYLEQRAEGAEADKVRETLTALAAK